MDDLLPDILTFQIHHYRKKGLRQKTTFSCNGRPAPWHSPPSTPSCAASYSKCSSLTSWRHRDRADPSLVSSVGLKVDKGHLVETTAQCPCTQNTLTIVTGNMVVEWEPMCSIWDHSCSLLRLWFSLFWFSVRIQLQLLLPDWIWFGCKEQYATQCYHTEIFGHKHMWRWI